VALSHIIDAINSAIPSGLAFTNIGTASQNFLDGRFGPLSRLTSRHPKVYRQGETAKKAGTSRHRPGSTTNGSDVVSASGLFTAIR
jgi:hypothetical protein